MKFIRQVVVGIIVCMPYVNHKYVSFPKRFQLSLKTCWRSFGYRKTHMSPMNNVCWTFAVMVKSVKTCCEISSNVVVVQGRITLSLWKNTDMLRSVTKKLFSLDIVASFLGASRKKKNNRILWNNERGKNAPVTSSSIWTTVCMNSVV